MLKTGVRGCSSKSNISGTCKIFFSKLKTETHRIRIRIIYWWNAETTITHQDLWLGNKSLALTREVNLATQSSESSADEIRESGRAFQSLIVWGKEATFINICIGNGSLKCHRVLIPTTPSFGEKVICWYTGFTFKTFIQQNKSIVFPPFLEGFPF